MTRLRAAWSWITSSPLRAASAGAVAVTALVAGVAFGSFVNGMREPEGAAGAPSASAEATPSASASASEASPTPTPVPSPSATAAPSPTAVPTLTPVPATPVPSEPTVASVYWPIGLGAVTITDQLRVRSEPSLSDPAVVYQPTLAKGATFRLAEGPIVASGYTWYRVTDISVPLNGDVTEGWVAAAATDGTPWFAPSLDGCAAFEFPAAPITVGSLADLQDGFLGTWVGCVTTPWVPPYPVVLTFRDDGTYSSVALVPGEPAMYYGSDDDSPEKQYALNDVQDSLNGVGQIDIYFGEGNTNRGELRNIKLMERQLEFEFFHRGQYGPLTYQLYRVDPSD